MSHKFSADGKMSKSKPIPEHEEMVNRNKKCDQCEKKAPLKCTSCKCVYYCSRHCQIRGWKSHKLLCKFISSKDYRATSAALKILPLNKQIHEYKKLTESLDPFPFDFSIQLAQAYKIRGSSSKANAGDWLRSHKVLAKTIQEWHNGGKERYTSDRSSLQNPTSFFSDVNMLYATVTNNAASFLYVPPFEEHEKEALHLFEAAIASFPHNKHTKNYDMRHVESVSHVGIAHTIVNRYVPNMRDEEWVPSEADVQELERALESAILSVSLSPKNKAAWGPHISQCEHIVKYSVQLLEEAIARLEKSR